MSSITLRVFKDRSASVTEALKEGGVQFSRRIQLANGPMAAGWAYEIFSATGAAPWGATAVVLVAWLRARSSRKLLITKPSGETIHLEGYSPQQVESLLSDIREIAAIDIKESNP